MEQEKCGEHSGVCERMRNAEQNIEKIWKAIDAMRAWVMAGMGALLIQAVVFIISLVKNP